MCDYSMHAIASRPAKVGETLVSTDFRGSSTRGFASAEETQVAVCLLPGTELVFEQNVTHRGRWFGSKKSPSASHNSASSIPRTRTNTTTRLPFQMGLRSSSTLS